jgi:hypothetical protein
MAVDNYSHPRAMTVAYAILGLMALAIVVWWVSSILRG